MSNAFNINLSEAHQGREAAGGRAGTAAKELVARLHRRHADRGAVGVGTEAIRCRGREWPHVLGRGSADSVLSIFVPVCTKQVGGEREAHSFFSEWVVTEINWYALVRLDRFSIK